MTLVIRTGETQRAFVERVLREQGAISAHDAMYALRDESGRPKGITRLAPVIEQLRKAGWPIDTDAPKGAQATYRLRARALNDSPQPAASLSPDAAGTPYDRDRVGQPLAVQPSAPAASKPGAEGAPSWSCVDCHGIPASEVEDRLGGMGWAYCRTCDGRRYFRRRAAA